MDEEIVTKHNIPFKKIWTGKLRRYFSWQNFIDPIKVGIGIIQSIIILWRFKPQTVFSKGGFVSLPVGIAAAILRIPLILHESDITPGLANKILAKFAHTLCISHHASEQFIQHKNLIFTGNPIREDLKPKDQHEQQQWISDGKDFLGRYVETGNNKQIILFLGGSSGAQALTQDALEVAKQFQDKALFVVQTGKGKTQPPQNNTLCIDFLERKDLKKLYQLADIVVSRAGAGTVAELAYLGKPTIFVPLPKTSSRGDQIINASALADDEAALLYEHHEPIQKLEKMIAKLLKEATYRSRLSRNIMKHSSEGAVKKIVKLIESIT
jgi:UDP-N-acetylglucosamine--N-acetylmuramyl-(pentapeptide) pyrophosphoryl-undecaprenol N-acetylglucosamine transferase